MQIRANALYESRYLLGTSLARPCITKTMVRLHTRVRPGVSGPPCVRAVCDFFDSLRVPGGDRRAREMQLRCAWVHGQGK
ncbi:MAG: argininosuccinate synthase domain-containing protein [Promethearchaeia archaeon]